MEIKSCLRRRNSKLSKSSLLSRRKLTIRSRWWSGLRLRLNCKRTAVGSAPCLGPCCIRSSAEGCEHGRGLKWMGIGKGFVTKNFYNALKLFFHSVTRKIFRPTSKRQKHVIFWMAAQWVSRSAARKISGEGRRKVTKHASGAGRLPFATSRSVDIFKRKLHSMSFSLDWLLSLLHCVFCLIFVLLFPGIC